MIQKSINIENTVLYYFEKGSAPKWLIYSGTHGDEDSVIPLIGEYLHDHEQELPDFIWVPEVSPSAVKLGKRNNEKDNNLNRIFNEKFADSEVLANLKLLKDKNFDVFVDFHEDPSTKAFYMYDSVDARNTEKLDALFAEVKSLGLPLYQGMDDEDLGWDVVDGYVVCQDYDTAPNMPVRYTSWKYLKENNIVKKRLLNPEIPGKVGQSEKRVLINGIFTFIQ